MAHPEDTMTTTATTTTAMPEPKDPKDENESDDDDDSDCAMAFLSLNLTGVDFDNNTVDHSNKDNVKDNDDTTTTALLDLEYRIMLDGGKTLRSDSGEHEDNDSVLSLIGNEYPHLVELANMIASGRYVDALKSPSADWLLKDHDDEDVNKDPEAAQNKFQSAVYNQLQSKLSSRIKTLANAVEAELVGVAAFNLFLQLNYTGPVIEDADEVLCKINPHPCFENHLQASREDRKQQQNTITARRATKYHNSVLSELVVDGQWPCQVSEVPYLLLLSRCIFSALVYASSSSNNTSWLAADDVGCENSVRRRGQAPEIFVEVTRRLSVVHLWHARAIVAHERLLMASEPSERLWKEAQMAFDCCLQKDNLVKKSSQLCAMIYLEYGLACYHFNHQKTGKKLFNEAMKASGVSVEVTGSEGKRTKFQRKATAQMIVRATSANVNGQQHRKAEQKESSKPTVEDKIEDPVSSSSSSPSSVHDSSLQVKSQMIEHTEDSILYERIQYEDSKDNETSHLSVLDQSILLALCLDVKNTNPADGLTGEQMGAYIARVLHHHDDWMVYSTALLERAWLEFEGNHTKERAILQMQALADQHTNRLTLTQSTRQSVEDSLPVEDRLRNVHGIVYPPRWQMLGDIATRYASLGIVTSAAEIYTEIESWDEVVECYRRAGKEKRAEEIVRERLKLHETPRMWMALGDLTEDPSYYEKAIELSRGRFAQAYINMGKYYFDKGDLSAAKDAYKNALQLRPLVSSVWFRVGTISMQLKDWNSALQAFSEVVQQEPDEAEAWANVAAVHMQNKHPDKAYPALVESLKHNRTNWRVWVSKLYTCLDLQKYDEAVQACNMLLDLKTSRSASGVPDLEERCVRATVKGIVENYDKAKSDNDSARVEVHRRSLSRVHTLLERLRASCNEPWVFETLAYFHETVGQDKEVLNNLMQEYRSLLSVKGWEKDDMQVRKMFQVASQIVHYQRGSKEQLTKSKFLVSSVIKKVQQARVDMSSVPNELGEMQQLADDLTKEIQSQS